MDSKRRNSSGTGPGSNYVSRRRRREPRSSSASDDGDTTRVENTVSRPLRAAGTVAVRRKTLVLDLDDTLVASTMAATRRYDFVLETAIGAHLCLLYVHKRPHLDTFLASVALWFDVVLYTAAEHGYGSAVADALDPRGTVFVRRLFRNDCVALDGIRTAKDLRRVDADPTSVVAVDNDCAAWPRDQANVVAVPPWQPGARNDSALLDLLPFLDALRTVKDVRSILLLRGLQPPPSQP